MLPSERGGTAVHKGWIYRYTWNPDIEATGTVYSPSFSHDCDRELWRSPEPSNDTLLKLGKATDHEARKAGPREESLC